MTIKFALVDAETAFSQDNIIADYGHGVKGEICLWCNSGGKVCKEDLKIIVIWRRFRYYCRTARLGCVAKRLI
jgi:hypothetical protein